MPAVKKKSNRKRFEEANMLPAKVRLNAHQREALDGLEPDEVDALISTHKKLLKKSPHVGIALGLGMVENNFLGSGK
jgi:hypothetical protein